MSDFVVDASVAVKWFLPEVHGPAAVRLLESGHALLVPDLLFPEVGNVLWKRVQRGETPAEAAASRLAALADLPLQVHPSSALAPLAFEIACRARRSMYDSTYLAVAVLRHCPVVTADRRLHDALHRTDFRHFTLWVEDVPPNPA